MYILNMTFPRGKETGTAIKQGYPSPQESTILPANMNSSLLTTGMTVPVTTPARNETLNGPVMNNTTVLRIRVLSPVPGTARGQVPEAGDRPVRAPVFGK